MNSTFYYSDSDMIVTSDRNMTDLSYKVCTEQKAIELLSIKDTDFNWVFWNDTEINRLINIKEVD
jgi:hypothetical protein